jgi:membrane protein
MDRLKRLVQAADDFQQRHRWLAFPVAVAKKFGEDQAGHRAALLAYYGFFSLFQLLLVAVTVLGSCSRAAPTWTSGSSTRRWPRSRSSGTRSGGA